MDDSRVIENFDYLWFSNNVFSPRTSLSCSIKHVEECVTENPGRVSTRSHYALYPLVRLFSSMNFSLSRKANVNENQSEPSSLIVENGENEPPSAAGISILTSPKCEEPERLKFDMEVTEYYYSPSPSPRSTEKEKRRRRKRKRSKRSVQRRRRKILGELELGFDDDDDHVKEVISESWSSNRMVEGDCGFNQMNTMPSISDNMAMKEHLKSWAYAVGCTVR